MKRFRLNIGFLLFGTVVATAVASYLFVRGYWAQGCIVAIFAVGTCIVLIWNLQSKLINTMSTFVSALEMNDTTMRVETGGDSELRRMSESMNRLSMLYHENMKELQTSKLYYDRVLKIMTHEMRNGISPIVAITNDMKQKPERYCGKTLADASCLLNSQAEGIRRFLDSYHTLTHLPEPKYEKINAGDYFDNLKQLFKSELEQRNLSENIVTYTIPEDMSLNIDSSLVNQVMINLLRNSLDAIAAEDQSKNAKIEVVLTVSESRPYLTLKDNGCGMTEDTIDNLFQPFFTTKEHGSGVGLSICRQIIRLHGGEINVRSLPHKGTTVIITL